jgi:hypothetical protein
MADPISGVCSQSSSDLIESDAGEGGMCGGTEGGMSVAPEAATSFPNESQLEDGYIPEYLLADEITADDSASKPRRPCPGSQGSNAQSGYLRELASAEGGVEGASGNPEELVVDPWGGGKGFTAELELPFGAGLQLMVVDDDEKGHGVILNGSVAVGIAAAIADGPGVGVLVGEVEYEGSFEEFNDTIQFSTNAGAGPAVGVRAYVTEDGCWAGDGVVFGAAADIGASASRSKTLYQTFESDDDAR